MARVLVIEDEKDLQVILEYNLRQVGHQVFQAFTGREGLITARTQKPEVILLDLMLPDTPGTDICRQLKQDPSTASVPVVVISAKGEEIDRVVGFELGADDYVVKPFSVRELSLRIQAILRRRTEEPVTLDKVVEFGCLRIDRGAHRAWVQNDEVELTQLEFRLLLTLYERRNRVQTRSSLLEDVWRMDGSLSTRTVDQHVKRLREKMGRAGNYIETVRGVGYRFAEAPEQVAQPV
jgi:two-component system phosphate regulon response regulator PhoB